MSGATARGEDRCMATLQSIGVVPEVMEHAAVHTVEEWMPVMASKPDAVVCKNMFLKGKKGELVLVFALASTETDLKVVCKTVGATSGSLRFATEEVLLEALGVTKGAVTPLALVNDEKKEVIVCVDSKVLACTQRLAVHPCRNDRTVLLSTANLLAFFKALNVKVQTVDFSVKPEDVKKPSAAAAAAAAPAAKKDDSKGETKLGIDVTKSQDFATWYSQVLTKAEMIEYYDISGCYIIRPWAYEIWELIHAFFGQRIREMGVEDCYFPMFVSKGALEREKEHVEGFAPEVAWVTKAGTSDLTEPVAIRPTSETVMYPIFAKWIRSYRDLPLKLNQWCNIVRWEFSHPTPFIRNREFLWQEGHTAHATKAEADKEVRQILDLYRQVYEELLAVPAVPGMKTEKEKFAGGLYTTTVETFIPEVGRGCQGGTSHCLGQNFGKMFHIEFEDPNASDGSKLIPFQNSWGLTTRSIGVMVMVHSDDKGLVLPPRVASVQVVIVPCGITAKTTDAERDELLVQATSLQRELCAGGVRAKADVRMNYSPGWRYNFWELKGVPLRIELGPQELKSRKLVICRRVDGAKVTIDWTATVASDLNVMLNRIHTEMFNRALALNTAQTREVLAWNDFTPTLNQKCRVIAPWCCETACEDAIKRDSAEESKILLQNVKEDERAPSMGAKSLCMPFYLEDRSVEGMKCICKNCTKPAKRWVMWGRSY